MFSRCFRTAREAGNSGRHYSCFITITCIVYINGDDAVKRLNMERRYRRCYSVRCTSTRSSISVADFPLDQVIRISLHFLGWNLNFRYPPRRSAAKKFKYK